MESSSVSFGASESCNSCTLSVSQTEAVVGVDMSASGSQVPCSFFSFPRCDSDFEDDDGSLEGI